LISRICGLIGYSWIFHQVYPTIRFSQNLFLISRARQILRSLMADDPYNTHIKLTYLNTYQNMSERRKALLELIGEGMQIKYKGIA